MVVLAILMRLCVPVLYTYVALHIINLPFLDSSPTALKKNNLFIIYFFVTSPHLMPQLLPR